MKKLFSGLRIENIRNNIVTIAERFPISFIVIGLLTASLLLLTHGDFSGIFSSYILRTSFSLIITFFLSLWVYIATESYSIAWIKKQRLQVFPVLFWVFFYLWFKFDTFSFETAIFFIVQLIWIIWFLFFAPYLKSLISWKWKQNVYYSYFYKISTVFLISFILWWVLFTLWSTGITAIITLFDIWEYMDKVYFDWAIFSLSVFTPLYALTQIPDAKSYSKDTFKENTFFSFLIKFACLPAIAWYFLILYSYSVKVLLNFSHWPKWEVCWLVIGFSTFWYTLYIFSYVFEEEYSLVKKFRFYFPYLVLPQIAMLFYAIFLRIWQYDITINRYFVVVFGLWLISISLYIIFSKQKFLAFIPAIITLFTILISIGPWSVYNLPESRQFSRLQNNLEQANILSGFTITPLSSSDDISKELSKEIYAGINYLCNFDNCQRIKELFPIEYQETLEKYKADHDEYSNNWLKENPEPGKWEIVNSITTQLKVKNSNYWSEFDNYLYLYLDSNNNHFPIDLESYESLIELSSYDYSWNKGLRWFIDIEKEFLYIKNWDDILDTVSLTEIFSKLKETYPQTESQIVAPQDLTFNLVWGKYDTRILLENINLREPKDSVEPISRYYWNTSWYILIKRR